MTTRFTARNSFGATVYDVDTKEKINDVISVDTELKQVECFYNPIRVHPDIDNEVETFVIKFASIYPIYGGGDRPCLFHCYGRIE